MSNINRYLPILFLLGIIFNFGCVIVFRLRLDRRNDNQYERFKGLIENRVADLSRDALVSIDSYFASNYISSVSSSTSLPSKESVIYDTVSSWNYSYCEVGSLTYAISNNRRYTVGDRFPRGGYITDIHPDGVVLDNKYWVDNTHNLQTTKLNSQNQIGVNKNGFANNTSYK